MNFLALGALCQALPSHPSSGLVTGIRLRNGIRTVYVRAEAVALRAFVRDRAKAIDPDLPAHVIVETPVAPDPKAV